MKDEAKTWWLFLGPMLHHPNFLKENPCRTLIWVPLLQAMTLNAIGNQKVWFLSKQV